MLMNIFNISIILVIIQIKQIKVISGKIEQQPMIDTNMRTGSKKSKATLKPSKESTYVKNKVAKGSKRNKGIKDYFNNMCSILRNILPESKGALNIDWNNIAIKHVDHLIQYNKSVTANKNDALKYEDITESLAGKLSAYVASHNNLNTSFGKINCFK